MGKGGMVAGEGQEDRQKGKEGHSRDILGVTEGGANLGCGREYVC